MKTKSIERIQIAGPSGIGKTTIANWLTTTVPMFPFISGSMSDLIPSTKDEKHEDMLSHDPKDLYIQDFQLLSLRNKLFANQESYVSDRSYLDNAAYFLLKQSKSIPQCEMENFFELCKKCLCEQVDMLIIFNFTPYLIKEWVMEDNNKRILNKFFQAEISTLMNFVLDYWGVTWESNQCFINKGMFLQNKVLHHGGYKEGIIKSIYGEVKILSIDEPQLEDRKDILRYILKLK